MSLRGVLRSTECNVYRPDDLFGLQELIDEPRLRVDAEGELAEVSGALVPIEFGLDFA